MARCALIRDSDGVVVNTIEAGGDYVPDPGFSVRPSATAAVGQRWDGANFITVAQPVVVPETLDKWRARAQLDKIGKQAQADALAAAAGPPISFFWASDEPIRRDSETLKTFAARLGVTDAQLDQMFIDGAAMTV